MSHKYFSYSGDAGFETFKTADEAKKDAEDTISYYEDNATEGWDEDVEHVCWGEIKQHTTQANVRSVKDAEEEGIIVSVGCDYVCDYLLEDINK